MPKAPVDVISGEVIESQWGNDIRNLTVQIMVDEADRDASYPVPVAGNAVYVADIRALQIYDGTVWQGYLPLEGITAAGLASPFMMQGNLGLGGNFVTDVAAIGGEAGERFYIYANAQTRLQFEADGTISMLDDTPSEPLPVFTYNPVNASMDAEITLRALVDPSSGGDQHVGNRAYNDARYVQQASPSAVKQIIRIGDTIQLGAGASAEKAISLAAFGITDTSRCVVNIIGTANNQWSYKAVFAYHSFTTSSITVRTTATEQIAGTGASTFQVQITEMAA